MRVAILLRCLVMVSMIAGWSLMANAASSFGAIEIRLVDDAPASDAPRLKLEGSQDIVAVSREPLLTSADFLDVGDVAWIEGRPGFHVILTPAGAKKLTALSAANVGKKLAIIVGGKLLMAPKILDPIVANGFLLTVEEETTARDLAAKVKEAISAQDQSRCPCCRVIGAFGESRTPDLRARSAMLYPLSYRRRGQPRPGRFPRAGKPPANRAGGGFLSFNFCFFACCPSRAVFRFSRGGW